MSQYTDELKEFAARLAEDGYPTYIVERAAIRMEALEYEIVRLTEQLELRNVAKLSNN